MKGKRVKVKILSFLPGVYPMYQPEVGKIYDAEYSPPMRRRTGFLQNSPVCFIEILDKKICLKTGEYEIVEG